jgi:hypothetical protein
MPGGGIEPVCYDAGMSILRLCSLLALLAVCSIRLASAADAPARYRPAGWPLDLALPATGQIRAPGDAAWQSDDRGDFIWEFPDGAANQDIMLFRVRGSRLPATTPAPPAQSDASLTALLTDLATTGADGLEVKLADQPRAVSVGADTWVRAQFTYGDPMLNRNAIVYLTYDGSRYYAVTGEYHFVIDAGLFDAESSTAGDAETALQQILYHPS